MKRIALLQILIIAALLPLQAQIEGEALIRTNDSLRAVTNQEFGDPEYSPLPEKEIEDFDGLRYFPVDTQYAVYARFVATPGEKPFQMPTTTDRMPRYQKAGELHFELQGQNLKLNVYRNLELSKKKGFENYYFLPFNDSTNGFETYGGGRYIDLRGPLGDSVLLDFNRAYNPYCAYNHRYSCPIPPPENRLPVYIRAGLMAWDKH